MAVEFAEAPTAAPRRGMSLASLVLLLGVLMATAVVGMQLYNQSKTSPTSGPAPDFTITTYDGQTFRLSEQRGKVVVLNFWGSWCPPCRDEAPDLQQVHEQYVDRGVVLVGVTWLDEEANARAFIDEFGLTFPSGPDQALRIADDYRITGAPETFVIDQEGNIVRHFVGPITDYSIYRIQDLTSLLDELLQGEDGA